MWKGGLAFEAEAPSGSKFVMDALPEGDGAGLGPGPMQALLGAVAACSAMDVVLILQKMRQQPTSYRIEIEGERPPQGQLPRPYTSITVRHILTGSNLDGEAVKRAVELSDEKYCSVMATLRASPAISSEWRIEP